MHDYDTFNRDVFGYVFPRGYVFIVRQWIDVRELLRDLHA
jgi:hypothetical protein